MLDPDAVTAFLEAEHGDVLRGVLFYDPHGYTLTTVRPDLAERYTDDHLEELARWGREEAMGTAVNPTLGSVLTSVRIFERATVVNFVLGEAEGVLISFDPDVENPTASIGSFAELNR